jgi:HK97 family phage portal protein
LRFPAVRQLATKVRAFTTVLYALTSYSAASLWTTISEPFTGAWQQNASEDSRPTVLKWPAVFHCVTGICNDIAKMRLMLMQEDSNEIWNELKDRRIPFLAVLKKPNHYQNHLQFIWRWVVSLLIYGNTYVLKERDERGIVIRMYILDPSIVTPQQATDGAIFYKLQPDLLAGIDEEFLARQEYPGSIPASEIIHDRINCLFHDLIGVSPLYSAAMAATMGKKIQDDATVFFGNSAMPGGIITGPDKISTETADRLKAKFEANYGGSNRGRIAVLGQNLKFEAMRATADASQVEEQYKLGIEDVARAFHYPVWKLTGQFPPYSSNPEMLTVTYYQDCLQPIIENIEALLDDGLSLPEDYHVVFDLENLMRMDMTSQIKMLGDGVLRALFSPNEARKKINQKPAPGGDSPMLQEQVHSLEALSRRDESLDPFGTASNPAPEPSPAPGPTRTVEPSEEEVNAMLQRLEILTRAELEQ